MPEVGVEILIPDIITNIVEIIINYSLFRSLANG